MKTIYLIGSICGIILMGVFCYQHRPYIERTAEVKETVGYCVNSNGSDISFCQDITDEIKKDYDFCGDEMTVTSTFENEYYFEKGLGWNLTDVISSTDVNTYIPCYKSKLKFR